MCSGTNAPRPGRTTLLSALANQYSRSVITYFRDASDDHASVEEVAAAVARRDQADETRVAIHLHHAVLPRLEDVGLVHYDARTRTVRYHGHSQLERAEEYLSESGSEVLPKSE